MGESRSWVGRALLVPLLVLASAALAGCSASSTPQGGSSTTLSHAGASSSSSTSEPGAPTTSPAPPTTKPADPPSAFGVGIRTTTFVETGRETLDYGNDPPTVLSADRTIVTEIRYPTLEGEGGSGEPIRRAPPAYEFAPFPVIVFAHGYAVMPDTYEELLDAWVRAGFVVVSPVFPVTNYYEWLRQGGGPLPENDIGNQPYDVAFVVGQLDALASGRSSFLSGLIDMSRMAFAGQSDGASTVAGLVWAGYYGPAYEAMSVRPRAVAILSGSEYPTLSYRDPSIGPAVLQVQSNTDYCNDTQQATELYDAIAPGAPGHYFLTVDGASHLGPYVGAEPWSGVVAEVTTAFFKMELNPRPGRSSPAGLFRAGDVEGVSGLSSASVVFLPPTADDSDCGTPTPFPPAGP